MVGFLYIVQTNVKEPWAFHEELQRDSIDGITFELLPVIGLRTSMVRMTANWMIGKRLLLNGCC